MAPTLSTGQRLAARGLLALLAATGGLAGGCGKGRAGVQPSGDTPALTASAPAGQRPMAGSSVDHYAAGRFAAAKGAAEAEHGSARNSRDRDVAALTAGLSAHALNQNADARNWLQPLTRSSDPQIAGRADATLGLIAQRENLHVIAVGHLDRAGKALTGDDAARAVMQAGHSLTVLGRHPEAHERYTAAAALASTDRVRDAMQAYAEPGPFALQLGVFASKPNAQKQAGQIGGRTSSLGLGQPQITPSGSGGKPGFAVRVGTFPSRQAAVLAKDRLGTQAIVVSAAQ